MTTPWPAASSPRTGRSSAQGRSGGLVELPRLLGEKLALELTGDAIAVERLERAGLVNRVVPAVEVEREALALAVRIAANGPLAVRASYRIIREARDADTEQAWALSMAIGLPVFASEDAREGATAFVEKRPPVWKGR